MKTIWKVFGVVAALGAAVPAYAAEFEMKISTMFPSTHFVQTLALEPWAKSIEERSGGRVHFTFYPAGSAFGDATRQFDQVSSGVVDIAVGVPANPRGRHPRTVLMELPFMVESSDAGTKALMDIYDEYLADDFPGTKMLSLTILEPNVIHTKEPVTDISQLKGMSLRSPTPAVTAMLQALGATPVGLPPTQVYENVERGVVDGNVTPWGVLHAFKLWEVLHNHLEAKFGSATMYTLMNQASYDRLPEDIKALFDGSIPYFSENWGKWWVETDKVGIDAAIANGNTIVQVSPEQLQKWREEMAPVIEAYISEQEKSLPDARSIYDAMIKAVAKYE